MFRTITLFVLSLTIFVVNLAHSQSFIAPDVPDFFGTIIVEVDGKPASFGSGFVKTVGGKTRFVTSKHVIKLEDEDLLSAKFRIFLKKSVQEVQALSSTRWSAVGDFAEITLSNTSLHPARIASNVQIGDELLVYGTGTSSEFRGIARGYYKHNPERDLWQHRIAVRVVEVDIPGCMISTNLCKDSLRAFFKQEGPEIRYVAVEPQEEVPGGFSGGPVINRQGEVVGILIGGSLEKRREIILPITER